MKRYKIMPHTVMEELADGCIRVYKKDSLEPDINTYAALVGSDFHNGTIEVDVCAKLLPDAPEYARGFIGLVFRASEDGREFESFYVRPTNGKNCDDPVRRSHGCQYFSYPGYTFAYFRKFGITDYENKVDSIELGKWSHLKAVVEEKQADFFVDEVHVLHVNDLKHEASARGNVGLYVDIGTNGFFKNLKIIYKD